MSTYYLIGFMGSGKSTIGEALSSQLDVSYIDTDTYIEHTAKR
ncbi:MAG TPA: shikimate kinase, partial [Candidatus Avamphibacillus intestinigallinarum]|nr:shikimate kinase [Candidatus Avamphibacillus intestinigallinarum]